MTDKKEEDRGGALGPLTLEYGPPEEVKISCPRHGARQTWVTFGDGLGWVSEKLCHRCHLEVQIGAIKKHQDPKVKEDPKDGEEIPNEWDDWILDWADYNTAGVPKDLVDYIDTEGRIPLAIGRHTDGRYFLVTEASTLFGWWDEIRSQEAELKAPTTGLFNPKYKPNPELTKLLKDAKPATEEELRAQRRGYAGLCWKAPSEWKSSNEFLERGDAMIQAIVAINPKVLDDEDHWLLLQVETLSRYIRVRPEQRAGLADPSPSNCKTTTPYHKALMSATKRRMYVAAHALRRRITPLADEGTTPDGD